MQLIPVLDLLGGLVVRAVGGRRSEYRPLAGSAEPLAVARKLLDLSGSQTLYVADLDAIQGTGTNAATWQALTKLGVVVAVDAGLRTVSDVQAFPVAHDLRPVAGSETLAGPEAAVALQVWAGEAIFSVDLCGGTLLGDWSAWRDHGVPGPEQVVAMASAGQTLSGTGAVILLDLASVGERGGPAAEVFVAAIRAALPPTVQLWLGGGVRHRDDVKRLADLGVHGVLVSTALHDGTLP